VVGLPTVAATIWALGKQAPGFARAVNPQDWTPERAFLGGLLSGNWSATWPLARLEFFGWGIRLGGSVRLVRWLIRPWEARYEELATVRLISSATSGVRIAVEGRTDAVVFWSFRDAGEIADRLEAHGVPVDRSVTTLRQAGGVYRSW
jgi:hypothetical protein